MSATWPCPNSQLPCQQPADQPGLNLTSEAADPFFVFPIYFPPRLMSNNPVIPIDLRDPTQKSTTVQGMEEIVHNHDPDPGGPGPGTQLTFRSRAQSCSATCPNGAVITINAPANLFTELTQAAADARALAYACELAAEVCAGAVLTITNTQQSCIVNCPNATTSSYTVTAGSFGGSNQAAADSNAYIFACKVALALCSGMPTLFYNTPQTCTWTCDDGRQFTVTVPESVYVGLTQAEADAGAQGLACELAQAMCSISPLFENEAQSCSMDCRGTPITYTVPAGVFSGTTLDEANSLAMTLACAVVRTLCTDGPPAPAVYVGNSAQRCVVSCPDDGEYSYVVAAGTILAATRAIANGYAHSIACLRAAENLMCLGALPEAICLSTAFSELVPRTGGPVVVTYVLTAGALPDGLVLDAGGLLVGTPTTIGSYFFTIAAMDDAGNFARRTYAMEVAGITTETLPDGDVTDPATAYSSTLAQSGIIDPVWTVIDGTLPPGLALGDISGTIYGDPSAGGLYTFTVQAAGTNATCAREFTILVTTVSGCPDWNNLAWGAPTIFAPPGTTGAFTPTTNSIHVTASNTAVDILSVTIQCTATLAAGTGLDPCNANLEVVASFVNASDPATINYFITVTDAGGSVIYGTTGTLDGSSGGTSNFPITVPAGEAVRVQATFGINNAFDSGSASFDIVATFTNV